MEFTRRERRRASLKAFIDRAVFALFIAITLVLVVYHVYSNSIRGEFRMIRKGMSAAEVATLLRSDCDALPIVPVCFFVSDSEFSGTYGALKQLPLIGNCLRLLQPHGFQGIVHLENGAVLCTEEIPVSVFAFPMSDMISVGQGIWVADDFVCFGYIYLH